MFLHARFSSCAAGISQLFPSACFLFALAFSYLPFLLWFPIAWGTSHNCSSSEALGFWPGFYYCSYELLTLLFQRYMKEADLEAFTCTAILSLVCPRNSLFSTSLVCVERGFYSLGVGHNSEQCSFTLPSLTVLKHLFLKYEQQICIKIYRRHIQRTQE